MQDTTRTKRTRTVRKTGPSRSDELTAATTSPTGTISAVMKQLPSGAGADDVTKEEKQILQGIAHGGEGYGHEYGSGPGVANAEATAVSPTAVPGDSASPAASAMTTMRRETIVQRNAQGPIVKSKQNDSAERQSDGTLTEKKRLPRSA